MFEKVREDSTCIENSELPIYTSQSSVLPPAIKPYNSSFPVAINNARVIVQCTKAQIHLGATTCETFFKRCCSSPFFDFEFLREPCDFFYIVHSYAYSISLKVGWSLCVPFWDQETHFKFWLIVRTTRLYFCIVRSRKCSKNLKVCWALLDCGSF